jgi:hypothetical protein
MTDAGLGFRGLSMQLRKLVNVIMAPGVGELRQIIARVRFWLSDDAAMA